MIRRAVLLALSSARRRLGRSLLTGALLTAAIVVFVAVTALSSASEDGLEAALESDVGARGTYGVSMLSSLSIDRGDLSQRVATALEPLATRPVIAVDVLPEIIPECPPFENLGSMSLIVRRDAAGQPMPMPSSAGLPPDGDLCLAGLTIPDSALHLPTPAEQTLYGPRPILDPRYEDHVAAAAGPVRLEFILTTGQDADLSQNINTRLVHALDEDARRAGIATHRAFTLQRLDRGAEIRAASDGISTFYQVLRWTVLALGAIAVLTVELVSVGERRWMFGLARSSGASRRHIAAVVTADVIILTAGAALASLTICLLAEPAMTEFGRQSFQTDLDLLTPTTLRDLAIALGGVATIGSLAPAIRATREDPIAILEAGG